MYINSIYKEVFQKGMVFYLLQEAEEDFMTILFWWIRQMVLIAVSGFFMYFGIRLLISAYELDDPFTFFMSFFASNFIILISGTLIICFAYRMITTAFRKSKKSDT